MTYKIWLPILGVALLAVVATLPELTAVWPERKVVRETFTTYTDALIKRRFAEAYAYHSPEFKEKITLDSFVHYQRDIESKFGALESVREQSMTVQKWRTPSYWQATIAAEFMYEKGRVRYTYELHRYDGVWKITNSSGQEL